MVNASRLIQDLGFVLYGAPLVVIAVWTALAIRKAGCAVAQPIRWQRRLGAFLGLSLGACIYGALAHRYLSTGGLTWHWSPAAEQEITIVLLVFIAMWISNIKLEIWSLEPLRKLDPRPEEGAPPDPAAYQSAARSLLRHQLVHAALLCAIAGLEISRRF